MLNKLFKYPLLNVIIIFIITLVFGYGITKIKISNDMIEMLSKKNEVYISDAKIKKTYNTGEVMFVGIKSKNGNILTIENLQTIDKMTKKIEDIQLPELQDKTEKKEKTENNENDKTDYSDLLDNIESGEVNQNETVKISNKQIFDSVNSITNIELIEGIDGGLAPVKIEKYIPTNEEELKLFKEKLLSWDLFQGTIYSKDFSASSISITFAGDSKEEEQMAAYREVKKIVDENKNEDMEIYYAGKPVVKAIVSEYIKKDLMVLIPIVIVVVIIILYLSFKNKKGVLLPLLTVFISTIWIMGIMGFFGIKLTLIGTIIPVLLIAVGSAYGIHVIAHYMEDKSKANKLLSKEENKTLVLNTVKNVALPVFLAALTTFFGFLSLLTVDIIPIKEFAILTGSGVIIEFIISLIFIPSVIILLKPKNEFKGIENNNANELPFFEKILIRIIKALKNRKKEIIIFFILLIIFLSYGITKISIDFDVLKYFRKNSDIVKSTQFINNNFSGADTIYINIIGEEDGDLAKTEILDFMDKFGIYMIKKYDTVGKVIGFNDMIKRMNQVMHYPDSDDYNTFIKKSMTYEDFFKILKSANIITNKINPQCCRYYKSFK
jgi:predicted RND superfamily exporter protein